MVLLGVIGEKSAIFLFYTPTVFPFAVSIVKPAGRRVVVVEAVVFSGIRPGGLLLLNLLVSLS
jgi:hypothetical protein